MMMRWSGHAARMRRMRNAYKSSVRKTDGKKPLGKSRRRLEINVRIDSERVSQKEKGLFKKKAHLL